MGAEAADVFALPANVRRFGIITAAMLNRLVAAPALLRPLLGPPNEPRLRIRPRSQLTAVCGALTTACVESPVLPTRSRATRHHAGIIQRISKAVLST